MKITMNKQAEALHRRIVGSPMAYPKFNKKALEAAVTNQFHRSKLKHIGNGKAEMIIDFENVNINEKGTPVRMLQFKVILVKDVKTDNYFIDGFGKA